MQFCIADTFTESLAKLTGEEQKAVKTTAFDLQINPANPGMQFHKLDKSRDPNFWSVRVNRDVRLIVHRTDTSLLLCYVDHHEEAYRWAERRKLEMHPKTGAAQLVEIRERVQEILVPIYKEISEQVSAKPRLFDHVADDELLGYGVPIEWLPDVRESNEDSLLKLANHLPSEAAEALLELATGGKPAASRPAVLQPLDVTFYSTKRVEELPADAGLHRLTGIDPFEHPDAQRRFRVMHNVEELALALDFPWDKWTIFLHPVQRELVERDFNGPARVAGSAGTGKTIVALHRAVNLARHNRESRILLTTFSDTLANALRAKLRRLLHHEPRLGENIEVYSINAIGRRLYELQFGAPNIVSDKLLRAALAEAAKEVGGPSNLLPPTSNKFSQQFLWTEWSEVVDAWQLDTWEAYRDVRRLGRKTRLPEPQRAVLWSIFDRVRSRLQADGSITYAGLFRRLAENLADGKRTPFDFAVVDEAQDINVAQLRFLAALGTGKPNSLFFAGDLGQRIFQQPFSWKVLGVDIRGRSRTLHINYRTSHQIRTQADRLLGPELSDVDGITEIRVGTISVFNGPAPEVRILKSPDEECQKVSEWLRDRNNQGVVPHEIGVFVRSPAELGRARAAVENAGFPFKVLDENVETSHGHVSISTMHLAKGLEFRAVVVMACDDEVIPLQERIETAADDSDLEEVYNTERHLLYVACTRARDHLLVTSVAPASEFLDDLKM
ncbi:MAG: UvrD-helicase domain-containing protein [Deltaproteobacteria bacterium]|nr:UvrD-helicase domain-containing protein [Deltaproteobacteria bacterium]